MNPTHASKTGYRGVSWDVRHHHFVMRIQKDGCMNSLIFSSAFEAALEYDKLARELFGKAAVLNFPSGAERKSIPVIPGQCPNGHPYIGGFNRCRECHTLAVRKNRLKKSLR
jgi:hypothetical protein